MITLFTDPGHGDHDPGAVGPAGTKESWAALDVCNRMREYLSDVDGLRVIQSRLDDDTFLNLGVRAEMANRVKADYFLSVHFNSAKNRSARGHEVFTSPGQTKADPFATDLFRSVEDRFPNLPARKAMGDGDPDKEAKFTVLVQTTMPAALYECEFISNSEGEQDILDEEWRQRMAEAIADGFLKHVGLQKPKPAKPDPVEPEDTNSEVARLTEEIDERTAAIRLLIQ